MRIFVLYVLELYRPCYYLEIELKTKFEAINLGIITIKTYNKNSFEINSKGRSDSM